MDTRKNIQLMCGPTTIPEVSIHAMNRQILFHRSREFEEITEQLNENLKKVFQTKQDVLTLTGSGTAAMEASVCNCFSEGDEVVVCVLGVFSDRMAKICEAYGLKVTRVTAKLGEALCVDEVMPYVTEHTKGVFLIHNESATGVTSDVKSFGEAFADTNTLLIVDSVSGLGSLPMYMDAWHVDVLFTGSQKALMGPPGLSLIALSEKAWNAVNHAKLPRFYLDLKVAREYARRNQHPWTPAVYSIIGLNESLKILTSDGMEAVYAHTKMLSDMVVNGLKELGISLFPNPACASKSVNTFAYGKSRAFVTALKDKFGISIYGGQDTLADSTFRVGTMGYVSETDVQAFLYAAKKVIACL